MHLYGGWLWFGGGRLVVRTSIFSKRSLCFFPGTSAECLAVKLVELSKLQVGEGGVKDWD